MIPVKTKLLNLFRAVFKVSFLEKLLLRVTVGRSNLSLWAKLVPNHYQYKHESVREVRRNGITLKLDISDYLGHFVYFGFAERGHDRLYSLCKPGYYVLDIGANIGDVLLHIAQKIGPSGKVWAFEPDPENYSNCLSNVGLNKFKNIQLVNIGMGNSDTESYLDSPYSQNSGMKRVSTDGVRIRLETLDGYLRNNNIPKVDIIKIDVEGFEFNVLKGGIGTIRDFRPTLFIELDDKYLNTYGSSAEEVIDFLRKFNYSITTAEDNLELKRVEDLANCHLDIICVAK